MKTKKCSTCRKIKELECFSFKNKLQGKYVSICKECNRAYQQQHYKNHQQDYKTKRTFHRQRYRSENRQKILEYLKIHPCVDCGENDCLVLEFDHVSGDKEENIGTMIQYSTSWDKILIEIGKCEVRCANCHKRKTAYQFGWYKTK